MTHPPDQSGPIPIPTPEQLAAPEGLTFLRSTTKIVTDREADGDTEVHVTHVARFAVRDGATPDLKPEHSLRGAAPFAPNWMEATWEDGKLNRVYASGPQRLKAGGTSEKVVRRRSWGGYSLRGTAVDRDDLPEAFAKAIADYEVAVSTVTGQS